MWMQYKLQILGFFLPFSPSSCYVNSPTDRNSQRILTYDGSKDEVSLKDVPLTCPKCSNQLLGVQNPQNCSNREIPAKTKTSNMAE